MNPILDTLFNGWWQGIVLTLVVWLVLRDMPRLTAATRLAIWHVTLAAVLLIPLLQRIPLPRWMMAPAQPAAREAGPTQTPPVAEFRFSAPPSLSARPPVIELEGPGDVDGFFAFLIVLAQFQLLRLAAGYLALRRLKRKATPAGLKLPVALRRQVDILLSDRIGMPMAVGYRRAAILVPSQMAATLSADEMKHVLLHESAHLVRRDDWIVLCERVVRALFSFHPAVHWICRQTDQEREMACDDWVVAQSGEAKPYAASLARLAELGSAGRAPILATGAGRPKAIFARLEKLLDRTRNGLPSVSEPLVMVAGLLILAAVYQGAQVNHLFGFWNYSSRWVETSNSHRREIKLRGEVRFTADDTGVETMSPGAKLVVRQEDAWGSRAVEFEGGPEGLFARRYFVSGREVPFNDEARRFVARILPPWVREQGIGIPDRLAGWIASRGPDAALSEIRSIRGAHVKRQYLEEFLGQTAATPWQLGKVLKVAGEMGSDYDKRLFLEQAGARYEAPEFEIHVAAYVDGIQSDHDRAELLLKLLDRDSVSPRLLRCIGRLSSDEAKARLLQTAAQGSKARISAEFFDAASTIRSDGELTRVLSAVLGSHGADGTTLARALRTAAGISSDGEKASVVAAASRDFRGNNPAALREAASLLGSIQSDGDRRRALEALHRADGDDAGTQREILQQVANMHSDHDKAEVLVQVAATFSEQEPVRRAFFAAAGSIHSGSDQRRVLLVVLARPSLSAETLLDLERTVAQIQSEEDRSALRKALARRS